MRRSLVLTTAVIAVLWITAAPAPAANVHAVSVADPYCFCVRVSVTFTAAAGEGNHMTAQFVPDPIEVVLDALPLPLDRPRSPGSYVIADVNPMTVTGQGCTATSPFLVRCGAGGGLSGTLGDRNDTLDVSAAGSFSGGPGDDRLTGSGLLAGDDGDDSIAGSGDLRGGNGDDYFVFTGGTISCGPGRDVVVAFAPVYDPACETSLPRR
jgi:hypothetical protein